MALVPTRVSVLTTATKIAENTASGSADDQSIKTVLVKNMTRTASIFLGGTNGVTTANGVEWEVDDAAFSCDLEPQEALWGIATVQQDVHVLLGGR